MREDLDTRDESLLQQKTYIFERTIDKVREIAASMGASRVYAERFSNTRWVRQELDSVSKIFLSINEIIKIDELEDVFELARKICKGENGEGPGEIFMELQMKNAFLLPGSITDDVKEFAIVEVSSDEGIPINRVVKV